MLKVGAIDYINFLPFYAAINQGAIKAPIEWVSGVPTALNAALRSRELEISPISSAEYLAHQDDYVLLPDFCVGAEQKVMSVCLYSNGDLNGGVVGLTSQSASSALLTKVLCHHFWHVTPTFVVLDKIDQLRRCDAFLLIGNDCLQTPEVAGFQTIDLAEAWYKATGLPFTFAVFAAHKDTKRDDIQIVRQALHQALTWGDQHPDAIERLAQEKCPLPPETLREYFDVLRFRLDAGQWEGLRHFANLAKALPHETQEVSRHAKTNLR